MAATKLYAEVAHCKGFDSFADHPGRWRLKIQADDHQPAIFAAVCSDWKVSSPFGSVESAVVVDDAGEPLFDRPIYREAPNVNCVVWGRDKEGVAKFAVIRQPRPHADDPENPDSKRALVFGQIVMGFLEKLVGKDLINRYESVTSGAAREAGEEAGAMVIKNIERPAYPWHNPNPTFVATWSELVFVEIDLAAVEAIKHDRHEPIFSAEYITASELRQRVTAGRDSKDAIYRMCTANSAWFIFFCCHPELFT